LQRFSQGVRAQRRNLEADLCMLKLRAFLRFPIHPVLWASYFFLHLFVSNAKLGLTLERLARPYGLTLAIAASAWLVLALIFKNVRRAALLVSAGLFIFFSAGYIHSAFAQALPIPDWAVMGSLSLGWLLLAVSLFQRKPNPDLATARVNLIVFLLLLTPLSQTIMYQIQHRHEPAPVFKSSQADAPLPARTLTPLQKMLPDVYYIILDEYAHQSALKEIFNYDNSAFLNALRTMGFYIADESFCNYMRTTISIPSSLNMQYLDFLPKQVGIDSMDTRVPFAMVRNNMAARMFKQIGYRYVMTDSGISPMDNSPLADKVFSFTGTDEFTSLLAQATMLKGAANDFIHEQSRNRHLFNFKAVETIPTIEGPTFAFLHLNMPHPPFVFDRNGNPSKAKKIEFKPNDYGPEYQQYYLDQLMYTNKAVLEMLQKILSRSERTPIIIIQSDHGLTPDEPWANTERFVRLRGRILNAYLVPPQMREKLYPSISPANSFRLLFKTVFKAPVELLEDRIYYSHYENKPYVFTDVTAVLKKSFEKSS